MTSKIRGITIIDADMGDSISMTNMVSKMFPNVSVSRLHAYQTASEMLDMVDDLGESVFGQIVLIDPVLIDGDGIEIIDKLHNCSFPPVVLVYSRAINIEKYSNTGLNVAGMFLKENGLVPMMNMVFNLIKNRG